MKVDYLADIGSIKRRILYGSDWHVLRRMSGYRDFLKAYEQVLKKAEFFLEDEMRNFRGDNAIEFLGLGPGGRNRQRLERFYQLNEIAPPAWFSLAGASIESTI